MIEAITDMFSHFNFAALDDPNFKEDAVREELLAPIIRRLGYSPTGRARVIRSKALTHPYVRIGTKKHPVSIVPDYTFLYDGKAILVLDAKRPTEGVLAPANVEQAYSYAIHPEIRCRHFALCNGRELSIFDVETIEPVVVLKVERVEEDWEKYIKFLTPRFLLEPVLRNFDPDFGTVILRMGYQSETRFTFPAVELQSLSRVSENVYTACAGYIWNDVDHLATFDIDATLISRLFTCLPSLVSDQAQYALSKAPFSISLDRILAVDIVARVGPLTQGQHEPFVPFEVLDIPEARISAALPLGCSDQNALKKFVLCATFSCALERKSVVHSTAQSR